MPEAVAEVLKIGGRRYAPIRSWGEVVEAYGSFLPPYPGFELLKPATVPPPPCVLAGWDTERSVRFVYQSYAHALDAVHFYPSRVVLRQLSKIKARKAITKDHAYKAAVAALPYLIEYKVPPAAWTAFSLRCWLYFLRTGSGSWDSRPSAVKSIRRTAPSLQWVFSTKRLQDRTDWFASKESRSGYARLKICAEHKALLRQYRALQAHLVSVPRLTKREVQSVVGQTLPKPQYDQVLASIRDIYETEQLVLDKQAARGLWLW